MKSKIFLNDIPDNYKNYKIIGKGKTSFCLEYDEENVIIITKDYSKYIWNMYHFDIKFSLIQNDTYIYKMKKLNKITNNDRKYLINSLSIFYKNKNQTITKILSLIDKNHILYDLLNFFENRDDFYFDLRLYNFMRDDKKIYLTDPVINKKLFHKYNNDIK